MELGEYDQAIEVFSTLLAGQPENGQIRYYLGIAYEEKGDMEGALRQFEAIPPEGPYGVKARIHLAFIQEKKGDVEGAIVTLRQLIADYPEQEDGYLYLGNMYETPCFEIPHFQGNHRSLKNINFTIHNYNDKEIR